MYHNFSPIQKKSLFSKKNTSSLVIDNNVLEYTFAKSRNKNSAEMKTDVYCAKNPFRAVKTLVSVCVNLSDLLYVDYNEFNKEMMVVGKFTVIYRNIASGQEIVRNYNENASCFCFTYNFSDVDKFLEILRGKMKLDACDVPLTPISL